jgi:hypothetical protein
MDELQPTQSIPESTSQVGKPLTYEETPVIEPIADPVKKTVPPSSDTPHPPHRYQEPEQRGGLPIIPIILFLLLFLFGYLISGNVRNFLSSSGSKKAVVLPTPTPALSPLEPRTTPATTSASGVEMGSSPADASTWKATSVVTGSNRSVLPGVSLRLPSDVLALICDSAACPSMGTNLSGGTRFTVAPRGVGQVLPNYQGKIVSDIRGKAFTVTNTTINGRTAVEFSGDFTGSTISGYSFTKMHGYMIELSPTLSLEINHFIPTGLTADFAKDEVTFQQIVKSVSYASGMSASPTGMAK